MTNQRQDFTDAIGRYPHLNGLLHDSQFVGKKGFLDKWADGDPLFCSHDVAWWLHTADWSANILTALDRAVGSALKVPDSDLKLVDLCRDSDWTWGHLVEIFLLSALRDAQASFTLPKSGADIEVTISGQSFSIEVTSLRRARWFPRLHERLDLLGNRHGVNFEFRYSRATVEHPDLNEQHAAMKALSHVLISLEAALNDGANDGSSDGRVHIDDYDLIVSWEPIAEFQGTIGSSSNLNPNHWRGDQLVMSAAKTKAKQLPPGRASAVLIDATNDEARDVSAFVSRLAAVDWSPSWDVVPIEAKHLLICEFSAQTGHSRLSKHLIHPHSQYPTPDGIDAWLERLFPPRPAPPVSASEAALFADLSNLDLPLDQIRS